MSIGHDWGAHMTETATAAAIIAGGQATRFGGVDKSRLHIEGQTIISRQAAVLQPLTADLFIVASQRERFADTPWRVYPDVLPGTGVAGAILTALESTTADRVLVVACDLPFLDRGLLQRLLDLAAEADAAWVETPAGAEPLLACYRRHAAATIRATIEAGHLKARDLDRVLHIRTVTLDELQTFGEPSRLLANINSPEDLSTIHSS
jgi:molybdopterin-guanine dinucleotide biosynthesis protein A